MGCDIHLYIEKRRKKEGAEWDNVPFRDRFSDRCYDMFAKLADVRNELKIEHLPIRGLPNDLADRAFDAAYISLGECPDNADSVLVERYGWAHFVDPDIHSPNWCTPKEMTKAVEDVFKFDKDTAQYVDWLALAHYMTAIESTGNYECRAVFWFDN